MIAEYHQHEMNYSQLVVTAIGEHGVNFNALRLLLQSLVANLGLSEQPIALGSLYTNNGTDNTMGTALNLKNGERLKGGSDVAEAPTAEELETSKDDLQVDFKLSNNETELKDVIENVSKLEKRLKTEEGTSSELSVHTFTTIGSSELNFFEQDVVVTTTSDSGSIDLRNLRPTYLPGNAFSADLRMRFDIFEHEIRQLMEERLNFYNESLKEYINSILKQQTTIERSISLASEEKEEPLLVSEPEHVLEDVKEEVSQIENVLRSSASKHAVSPRWSNDEVLAIRRDIYHIFAKVDCISAEMLTLGQVHMETQFSEIRKDLVDIKKAVNSNVTAIMDMLRRLNTNMISIHVNKQKLADLLSNKVDRQEYEMGMAEKVDYSYVRRKASHADLEDVYGKVAAEVYDARKLTTDTEKNIMKYIDALEARFGTRSVNDKLATFHKEMQTKIAEIRAECLDLWKKSKECTAGGITQLAANCLSCGSRCAVTNNTHKKVPLRNAHRTPTIAPIVTLQVSTLNSGPDKVGYIEQSKRSFGSMKINTKYNSKCMG